MDDAMLEELEKKLSEIYPFGVPRKEIGTATGNVLHPRACANNDCSGQGIPGRYRIGRNVVYPVSGIIQKIKSKMVMIHA